MMYEPMPATAGVCDYVECIQHLFYRLGHRPIARGKRAFAFQFPQKKGLFLFLFPLGKRRALGVEVTQQFIKDFGMPFGMLSHIESNQRDAEAMGASERIQQCAIGDGPQAAGTQRAIAKTKRLQQVFVRLEDLLGPLDLPSAQSPCRPVAVALSLRSTTR